MSTQNTNSGRGTQNNNNTAQQNVNYGGGQVNNNFDMTVPERTFLVFQFNVKIFLDVVLVSALQRLWDAIVGVGASHTAEQQFERGACLEGTREAVLAILREWGLIEDQLLPICWLSGAAGVGKSSIALTIAKVYEEKGVLVSSFFFFRFDPKRNNPSALIPTIATGLATTIPHIQDHVKERLSRNPTILDATLEEQFRELVVEPTLKWSRHERAIRGSPVGPQIVILDALDECDHEETQLRILTIIRSTYEQNPEFPLRFLICSRPEAWLREAFGDQRLRKLSKVIVLDKTFKPNSDIRHYYLHHFREIASSPKYNHIPFSRPWPSEWELDILVERSCGQFVYAATVIRFIKLVYCHPIAQLRTIIDRTPPRRGTSPYQQLDVLYDFILSVHPDHEELLSVLAALLVLPENLRSPTCIELVLGLPEGQVALTLRGMHSVLIIHGQGDRIGVHHTSFTDYLTDQTRSLDYHINKKKQRHPIVQQWVQSLATSRIQTHRSRLNQLNSSETRTFFTGWIGLCVSITEPSWKLLVDMHNLDFASVYMALVIDNDWEIDWEKTFGALLSWLKNCRMPKHGSVKDKERLMRKFKERPKCFHLEWRPGVYLSESALVWVVAAATGCVWYLEGRKPINSRQIPYLTDCHCDLSGEDRSRDSRHLTYQEACMQVVRSYIHRFKKIIQNGEGAKPGGPAPPVSERLIDNLVCSSLLKHCHLDTELLSLCRTLIELVKRLKKGPLLNTHHTEGRENLIEWIEAFPDSLAVEAEGLKAQLLTWGFS
ncbi:hypothetical protein PM082_000651 [Marasmius tenuissimus]|nr:hypothetical protein PM082_000651 [Marasmius tenuissimus]